MKTDSFSGIPNTKYLFNNMIFKLNLLNRTVVCGVKIFFSKILMSRHIDILQILWIYTVAASPVSMAGMARQLIDSRI